MERVRDSTNKPSATASGVTNGESNPCNGNAVPNCEPPKASTVKQSYQENKNECSSETVNTQGAAGVVTPLAVPPNQKIAEAPKAPASSQEKKRDSSNEVLAEGRPPAPGPSRVPCSPSSNPPVLESYFKVNTNFRNDMVIVLLVTFKPHFYFIFS